MQCSAQQCNTSLSSARQCGEEDTTERHRTVQYSTVSILSTCPLHTNNEFGKREARIKSVTKTTFRATGWLCAGGLSAVNAINTQKHDPIKSELAPWCRAVYIHKWTPPRESEESCR